jgi:phage N-6-adenine-methyltransferase
VYNIEHMNENRYSRKYDEWSTPQDFFDPLDQKYEFVFDLACSPNNCKTRDGFTKEDDAIDQDWALITQDTKGGWLWLNPPLSKIEEFVDKAWFEMTLGAKIVMLVPAFTDAEWFHKFIYKQDGVTFEFVRGRLKSDDSESTVPFPSLLVIFEKKS